MLFSTEEVKNELLERIEKILNSDNQYSKMEFEIIVKKILTDIEKRHKNKHLTIPDNHDKPKKPLSSYNLFIKQTIPNLTGTSVDRFKIACQMWKDLKDKVPLKDQIQQPDNNSAAVTKSRLFELSLQPEGHIYMFWLDAFESRGTLYLFGKVINFF